MKSRNPLFRRFSRLDELQVVDMALSELEMHIQKRSREPVAVIRRVGSAMQMKLKQIRTASDRCNDILRRALSSSGGYTSLMEMVLDLRRVRVDVEADHARRLSAQAAARRERPQKTPFYEKARRPLALTVWLLLGAGVLSAAGIGVHYLYPNGIFLTPVEVPSLVGQNLKETMPNEDLFALDITYQFHSDAETGVILSQSPQAGMTRRVAPGKHPCTLSLLVSLGPQQVQVGEWDGMTKYQAMTECRRLGLVPKIKYVDGHPVGNVARTEPAAGEVVVRGSTVTLYVGNATHVTQVVVPNLVGNSEVSASTMLSSLGLSRGSVSYMASDRPSGVVIAQSVLSGTAVRAGTKVSLVVSRGNAQ